MSILNLDKLLAPISDELPCGLCKETSENLDLEAAFGLVQFAADIARKIEKAKAELELLAPAVRKDVIKDSAGRSNDPKKDPGWPAIATQCCEILESKSKDTRVLAWLIESMARSSGFHGLSEALEVSAGLVEAHGKELLPHSPEESFYALAFLDKLNQSSSLIDGLGRITLSRDSSVCFRAKLIARHLEGLPPDQRDELMESGLLLYEDIEKEIEQSDEGDLREFLLGIEISIANAELLDQALGKQSGKAGFGFGRVLSELKTIQEWFKELTHGKLAASDASEQSEDSSDGANDSEGNDSDRTNKQSGNTKTGNLQSREEALNQLLKVASFFRKTEPHSPLSYTLEQAVRWGKMPLPELLNDLVQDPAVRAEVFRRMGIVEKSVEDTE